jgi:c-di-GMP-binding flagellar brake protein YcgR
MLSRDRRLGFRVPLEIFLTQYIRERPFRGLTSNISDTGLYLETVKTAQPRLAAGRATVGLEFELPGTGEIIWARGEVCYGQPDGYTLGCGVRFTAMPLVHARLVREYCIEARRAHLNALLDRIRNPRLVAAS